MAAGITDRVVPGEEFVEELESTRMELTQGRLLRQRPRATDVAEMAERRRQFHRGGSGVVKMNVERYLNCDVKEVRQEQLRKLIEEAGEDTFGGQWPAHATLARWESHPFGLTDDEISELEKQDSSPESVVSAGWWMGVQRGHWALAIGTALVGEGQKLNPKVREVLLRDLDLYREDLIELGVEDLEHALANRVVHSGVDIEHSEFDARIIRDFCTTPELQEQMRRLFILTIQDQDRKGL
jgi:pyrroloquinoline quinone (PQQ) biosynthesis protein C